MSRQRVCILPLAAALLAAIAVPAFAAHPFFAPVVYRVRPGTVVQACGGFAFHCEAWHLRGTLEVSFEQHDHVSIVIENAIVDSHLELVTAAGHATPFPHPGDLPLTALLGSSEGAQLVFESPMGSLQTARLTLTPFVLEPGGFEGGLLLGGFYDEGCCDRFRIDLGNVVLRPDRGVASLDLHGGRFHVVAHWQASRGRGGDGQPVALDHASGYFWFFQPDNPEVFVKILDACALSGRYWLFAGGLTNLGVDISFVDDWNDFAIPVVNPRGRKFATFIDPVGFPCDAVPGG
jgi:hypothetical protein